MDDAIITRYEDFLKTVRGSLDGTLVSVVEARVPAGAGFVVTPLALGRKIG